MFSIVQSDSIDFLNSLEPDSVDLITTSPPYEDCRLFLEEGKDLGISKKPQEWLDWMVEVARASVRVCTGLCVFVVSGTVRDFSYSCTPELLTARLVQEGFTLRRPVIFYRQGIPGSGGPDDLRNDYEFCLRVTRGGKLPWSDNTACGHPPKWTPGGEFSHRLSDGTRINQWGGSEKRTLRQKDGTLKKENRKSHVYTTKASNRKNNGERKQEIYEPPVLANPGNVINRGHVGKGHMGSDLAHQNEAPYPEWLAEFFVLSFCPPGGVVCDPFLGSGTTAAVALKHCRKFVGCDLRQSQVELAKRRLFQVTPLALFEGA